MPLELLKKINLAKEEEAGTVRPAVNETEDVQREQLERLKQRIKKRN